LTKKVSGTKVCDTIFGPKTNCFPMTLAEAAGSMYAFLDTAQKLLGFPDYTKCKAFGGVQPLSNLPIHGRPGWEDIRRRIFNIQQAIGVLQDNVPGPDVNHPDPTKPM